MTVNGQSGKLSQEKIGRKKVKESLRWSEKILRRVLDANPDHIAVIDRDLRILHSNWRGGYEYVDEEIRDRSPICYQAYYPGQERHCEQCHVLEVFRTGRPVTMEKVNPKIGTVEIRAYPLFDETGEVVMVVEHIRNISERKKMEDEIRENEEKFRAIFDNASEGIFLVGADTKFLDCNSAACKLYGCEKNELLTVNPTSMSPPVQPDGRDSKVKADEILAAALRNEPQLFEWRQQKFDGSQFDVEIQLNRLELTGEPMLLAVIRDITERKRLEEALRKSQDELLAQNRQLKDLFQQVEHQAQHDVLTSLPNRFLLADRIHQALLLARRNNNLVAVIFVDLDNLKFINDSLGHDIGDELIKTTAQRLTECVRASDTVARQGGDEFIIIIADVAAEDFVAAIAGKIKEAISRPVMLKGHETTVTCSIGISIFPKDGDDARTLINYADMAVYRAKEMGRNNFQFYSEEMNARSVARLIMEKHLRKALDNKEFTLHYQPKVSLRSGFITGMEALLRWQNPELGMVSPVNFIPLAEETGLINPIGEWVLRTACSQNRAWQESGLPSLRVAVNVSVCQFRYTDLTAVIGRVLRETGLDPHYLELEVTESAVIQNVDKMLKSLSELQEMGIHLAMDDFGNGYASLYYLKQFSFDKLKLDNSFVRDVISNPDSSTIARTVIAMAHSLNLKVIAEGVETEGQLHYLREHDCDEMQGYYFSRPIPAAEFAGLLQMGHSLKFAADDASSPKKCILVVDDEEYTARALERTLSLDGYRILIAKSAVEGFDLLATNRVAIVVADLWMPEMNGSEFLGKVRKIHPDTVRILITGRGDLESVTFAINYSAIFKFLTKPWDDGFLRDMVSDAFRHYESLQHIAQKPSKRGKWSSEP